MEKREEKKREIQRITKSSSTCNGVSSDEYIPIDLTWEILMRLPAKSIVRFRCVSKLWWSITTQQDFINSFALRQSSILCQSLLLTFMAKDDQHKQKIVIITTIVLLKEHITLLQPKISKPLKIYLRYDPKENTYKLLSVANLNTLWDEYQKPHILTLGSQESWRVIKNSPDHKPTSRYYCINGVVYYNGYISSEEHRRGHNTVPAFTKEFELGVRVKHIIMSFDVRSEKFKSIQIPSSGHQYELMCYKSLMSYKGKLAWVCCDSNIIKLWVLLDAGKQEWSENEFVLPSLPQRDLFGSARLSGATSTGEFIYVSGKHFKDISAFYYDPVRKTITSVKGLYYEEFRCCYGFSNDEMACLRSYPNHIESLMSLRNIM